MSKVKFCYYSECQNELTVNQIKNKGKFCSQSCAAKHNNSLLSDEQKIKKNKNISIKLKEIRKPKSDEFGDHSKVYLRRCKYTDILFYSKSPRKMIHPTVYETFEHYKQLCKFKFKLTDYYDWFCDDIALIKQKGWYSAANHGNNLSGVSKDHKISVSFGFKNKIDPAIISHPANCRVITQIENCRKNYNSNMSLDNLLILIEDFNQRYGF